MDTPVFDKGIRINPAPMQAGVGTIQQAIYQAHNSDCGKNKLIYDPIGITDIRYIDLKDILEQSMNGVNALAALDTLQEVATSYLESASPTNRLLYLQALQNWAIAIGDDIPNLTIPGYEYRLTVYDANGNTIFDNRTPSLLPTTGTPPQYTQTPLVPGNPFSLLSTNLFGLTTNPGFLAYLTNPGVQTSAFVVNQASMPETIMAVSSLLQDPANTRTFGFMYYGFAARQQSPNYEKTYNQGQIGYYACYIFDLKSTTLNTEFMKYPIIESIFVRLGLEQAPL